MPSPESPTRKRGFGCFHSMYDFLVSWELDFSLLHDAVDHGLPRYTDLGIDKDPDLMSPHGDPRFAALVAYAKEKAAAAQKPK